MQITTQNTGTIQSSNFNKNSIYWLSGFAIATALVWNVPYGLLILYPFTILGTWFHEMAHGIAAIILGGSFHRLELYANGSGVAYFSGDLFLGNIGTALVALAGPIGPTIAGTIFIISSGFYRPTQVILFLLGLLMMASAIIWVRSPFGVIFVLVLGGLILYTGVKAGPKLKQILLQFLGIQAIVSVYLSIGYLFSSGVESSQFQMKSDTAVAEMYLLLPYWFWAILILAFSVFMFVYSMYVIYKKSRKSI